MTLSRFIREAIRGAGRDSARGFGGEWQYRVDSLPIVIGRPAGVCQLGGGISSA